MSLVYVCVREIEVLCKDMYLKSLFYGVMLNATQSLLGIKISFVSDDKVWSVVKVYCK